MSFHRISTRPVKPKRGARKKKPPEWDSTVSDLSQYKASPEEVVRRKEAHRSANLELIRQQQRIKAAREAQLKSDQSTSSFLLREILHDQSELQETLAQSDRALQVVKDLFGDEARKYKGIPNLTVAPRQHSFNDKERLENLVPPITRGPTELEKLSESVLDKTALNEVEEDDQKYDDENKENIEYQGIMDMHRFRQYLKRERQETDPSFHKTIEESRNSLDEETPVKDGPGAINDTIKVKRTMAHRTPLKSLVDKPSITGNQGANFQKVLGDLEVQLTNIEQRQKINNSRASPNLSDNQGANGTFTGYAESVMEAITRITHSLKETEDILMNEANLRQQLASEVVNIKNVTDALKTDVTQIKESQRRFEISLQEHRQETLEQINYLTCLICNTTDREGGAVKLPARPQTSHGTPRKSQVLSSASVDELAHEMSSVLSSVPEHVKSTKPAIMLSPPRQNHSFRNEGDSMQPPAEGISAMTQKIMHLGQEHMKAQERLHHLQNMYGSLGTNHKNKIELQNSRPAFIQPDLPVSRRYSKPEVYNNSRREFEVESQQTKSDVNVSKKQNGSLHESGVCLASPVRPRPGVGPGYGSFNSNYSNSEVADGNSVQHDDWRLEESQDMNGSSRISETPVRWNSNTQALVNQQAERPSIYRQEDKENEAFLKLKEKESLNKQIEELTKQHSEAQSKLQEMMNKQHFLQEEKYYHDASPSISPIPDGQAEKDVVECQWTTPTEKVSKRGITVALPRVEDISMTSTPSPNTEPNTGRPALRLDVAWQKSHKSQTQNGKTKGDWLALSAHTHNKS